MKLADLIEEQLNEVRAAARDAARVTRDQSDIDRTYASVDGRIERIDRRIASLEAQRAETEKRLAEAIAEQQELRKRLLKEVEAVSQRGRTGQSGRGDGDDARAGQAGPKARGAARPRAAKSRKDDG